jgi:hypothetical protein
MEPADSAARAEKIVDLVTCAQRVRISSLLEELGYVPSNAFYLWQLKSITGRSRIRTAREAETAIGILEMILARRSGGAAAEEPHTDRGGRAA